MKRLAGCLLVFLVPACDLAEASHARAEKVAEDADVHTGAAEVEALVRRVGSLDAVALAEVRNATSLLQVNCPYTRSTFQLPVALSPGLDTVQGQGLDPDQLRLLQRLKSDLQRHVVALDALAGRDWSMPGPGDHLDHMDATALVTRGARGLG